MSDNTNRPVPERDRCITAWRNVCVKLGHGKASELRNGDGSLQEMHAGRKLVRQAVNAINADLGYRDPTEEEMDALKHASKLIASYSAGIDHFENERRPGEKSRVLRTSADIRKHYDKGGFAEAEFGLDDFFRGVANLPTTQAVKNTLSVGTDSAGGYSVPHVLMPRILEALAPASALIQAGMGIVPVEEGARSFTTALVDTIPTAAWRAENGAVAESDPAFRGVVVTPRSLSFFFKLSRELLADSPNLNGALITTIGQALAKELDRTGLRGTGTAPEPRGLLNTSGVKSVTNGTNGALLSGYENIFTAAQKLLEGDAPMPTAAIMSPRSLIRLGSAADTTNQPLAVPPMLQDLKLLATSQVPNNLTVGSSSDCSEIYVGDFTKMGMVLRESLSVQLLVEHFATTGQLAFVCHCRADFAVLYPAAFAVITGVR